MSSARHLHGLSDLGKTEFHTPGYWILDQVVLITARVISTSSHEWHKWESCMACWADRTSRLQWYTGYWSVAKTIQSSLRSRQMSCYQMVRMNDNYLGSVLKVHLFNHSTNTISPTNENRQMVWRIRHSWGVLVRAQFHFVLVDYSD